MTKTAVENKWEIKKIKEVGRVVTGKTPPTRIKEYFGKKFPFITPTDIIGNSRFIDYPARYLSDKGYEYQRNLAIPSNTVCFTCIGSTVGKMAMTNRLSFTNQQINSIIVDSNIADYRYIFYLLKIEVERIKNYAGGAAKPIVSKSIFEEISIPCPPLPIQHKIASILSAYDDLIELNERRIKILEEMARLIYKEWVVKFRFPGYEKVKMVKSELGMIPEGWEVRKVEELVERIHPGKLYDSNTVKRSGKVPVLDQGRSGIIGYHDDEPGVKASEDNPIIVFANHTCYQNLILFSFSAIQNVLPFIPSKANFRNIIWLHWATKDLVRFHDYKGHWPEFVNKKLLVPPSLICDDFGKVVRPMVLQKYKLQQQNSNLRQTRDMLLPRLIRGKIKVKL